MVSLSNFPNLDVVSFMSPEGLIKHLTFRVRGGSGIDKCIWKSLDKFEVA